MEDLNAHYSIGDAMTFEEMADVKRGEKELSLYNPFENSLEENPYLFEDEPVGLRRFVVANIVGEKFPQKHKDKKCMMKIKVSTVSSEKATQMCALIQEKQTTFGLYVLEMFKFVCLPPLECDADSEMNTAISMEYSSVDDNHNEFVKRRECMKNEVKRHNEIKNRVAAGELDESQVESAPVRPEEVKTTNRETIDSMDDSMEPDIPLCNDKYAVLATLTITKYEKMKDHIILKICGTFETVEDATSQMKNLKKDTKYKLFDVTVCDMYAWLQMPPPYELIENVMYDSEKLTETLGQRKKVINIDSSDLQCPQDL